jgi:ribosomal-protein-alanine N-acetyltransferase
MNWTVYRIVGWLDKTLFRIVYKGESMKAIVTKRLVLRDFEKADWRAVQDYASDPEVVRYVDFGPNTEEESRNFIQRALASQKGQPRNNFSLAVILKAKNALIGGCGIYVSNPANREGYIGYVLNRNFWKLGYATETVQALVKFGFKELKLHRIFATCDAENSASAHVMEKVGMQREAHFRENGWVKGKWRDSLLYAILEGESKKSKPSKIE